MNKSENLSELAKSLSLVQMEMDSANKSTNNNFYRSKYADLGEILKCVKSVCGKHGISFMQMPFFKNPEVYIETLIMHNSGEWISSTCSCIAVKLDPQGIGSAITYLRRYTLASVFGVAQEDDDGNSHILNPPPLQKKVSSSYNSLKPPSLIPKSTNDINSKLPTFNEEEFLRMKSAFETKIIENKRTATQILENLQKNFVVPVEIGDKILKLDCLYGVNN